MSWLRCAALRRVLWSGRVPSPISASNPNPNRVKTSSFNSICVDLERCRCRPRLVRAFANELISSEGSR
uniref:Putative secreted protein n=1 Tax=Anopheles darlingi TaxID=43151 RepID=A0A2M4D4H6_ANODA